jgi:glucokinase
MKEYYAGVDIGGSYVRIVIADEDQILIKITSETVKSGPIEALATQIIHMIVRGLDDLKIPRNSLKAIGTSSAGPFVGGESISTPNICCVDNTNDWEVIPYIQELKNFFGSDVKLELANDCVGAVKAEHTFGAGKGVKNCVYVTISTGIGAGIVCDGVLLNGKGKNAGHFGHMIVKRDGDLCGCGQHGCIESIASGRNISRRAKEAGLKYKGKDDFTSKEVFELYRSGDYIAKKVIQETVDYLGILFINICNILDTEVLVVGGSVFLNNTDIILPQIQDYITHHSIAILSEGVQIKTPELGDYVGDIAGLSLVLKDELITKWQKVKPWLSGIKKNLVISTEEAMKYK